MTGEQGPAERLAQALLPAFRDDFPERVPSAQAFAELLLDATEAALPLIQGGPAQPALAAFELLATRLDLYDWDGPPGWDEVVARGLRPAAGVEVGPFQIAAAGAAADRAALLASLELLARDEAARLVAQGKLASRGAEPAQLIALHASMLRLLALSTAAAPLALAEQADAGQLPLPAEAALVAEMDERARLGSDFAAAQEEWLARLLHDNPAAAAAPAFRTFFAGLAQSLRTALALRALRDGARAGSLEADVEALLSAVGGWQPVRWAGLRAGGPASFFCELFPAADALPARAELARQCSAALDALGRLWTAKGLSLAGFTALACAFTARSAAALALWEELAAAAP